MDLKGKQGNQPKLLYQSFPLSSAVLSSGVEGLHSWPSVQTTPDFNSWLSTVPPELYF